MKLLNVILAIAASAAIASAQLVTNFSSSAEWGSSLGSGVTVNAGVATVVGGSTDSYLYLFDTPVTIPSGDFVVLTGLFNGGNSSSSISVQFVGLDIDSNVVFLNGYSFPLTGVLSAVSVPYGAPFGQSAVGFFVGGDGAFSFNANLDTL